ncbi:hypothetical protein MASR2M78_06980 [Treponema sp.]
MKSIFIFCSVTILFLASALSVQAETRLSVDTELLNSVFSQNGVDEEWNYVYSGKADLSLRNKGSRAIRSEVSLEFSEASATSQVSIRKMYIRPSFGDALVSLGKTRSTWGTGTAFNAGDILFGSSSINFDTTSSEPRSETAWLTNVEIPLGDFSFMEFIVLPPTSSGSTGLGSTAVSKASAGGRLSLEAGPFHLQTGYLYRGDAIAGIGNSGQKAFLSIAGISPIDWQLSASAYTFVDAFSPTQIRDSAMLSGGASYDLHFGLAKDSTLALQIEFLVKPSASFKKEVGAEYGLYLYPSISLIPPGTIAYSVNSIISPIDTSALSTLAASWNIYEELTLLGYLSVQTGAREATFNPDKPGGISMSAGARYSF